MSAASYTHSSSITFGSHGKSLVHLSGANLSELDSFCLFVGGENTDPAKLKCKCRTVQILSPGKFCQIDILSPQEINVFVNTTDVIAHFWVNFPYAG